MKKIDYYLQDRRIDMVRPYLKHTDRVLDIGSFDGTLAKRINNYAEYVGIDPEATTQRQSTKITLIKGWFPDDLPNQDLFDVITMLAILEHIPENHILPFAKSCADFLKSGGRLLLTVPHPFVDKILQVLMALNIVDGMEVEAHHGFDASKTPEIFQAVGFKLIIHKRFQLGLNNFYAFSKL